nr:retrotransposon protein, putative, Ty1-copia subclass [Tanacetum cinerariifolium]
MEGYGGGGLSLVVFGSGGSEQSSVLLLIELKSESSFCKMNGGSFGIGNDTVSLRSMEIISEVKEGQSVSSYVLKMKGYIDKLERLGHPVTLGLGVSLILIGLRKEYDGFVQNYMHNMGKTVNELHAMLKLHEQTLTLPKSNAPALHDIQVGKVQKVNKYKKSYSQTAARGKNHGKGKNKQAYALKPKIPPPPKRENLAKDSICHECGEIGHWKRNCPQYLAELMKKKKKNTTLGAGGSGIFVIELNTILNRSWIYDTGCGTQICNTTQGLRASRKLKPGALILYMGNGQREAVEAIGVFYLCLRSGLEIVLNNCHYAPSITRGVISVSSLYGDGFINRFVDNTIQVSRNNVVYFSVVPRDERRNKTLLDMLRSMMSQTTLPKSFWDYVLKTAARILNMVLTKKVEKTPYEVWHGKAPKSTRTQHAPNHMCLYINAEEHKLGDLRKPANYKAALLDPDKWFFKKKTDMDGNVHIYKARLVVKGYTQTPWIDYEETFSPVADIRAIRILIAIAAYYDYEIWQMDVKTAFLNGYFNKEVYMEQPEGFVDTKYPNHVCKLKRSIYGLKQASRQWNKRFNDEIKKFGFIQNHDEPCSVKTYLEKCFAMKDLGEAAYILGIKIYRDRSKRLIGLCQSAYIEKILKRYCMENSKRRSIPMQEKLKLSKSQCASTPAEMKRMQNVLYASAVGSIMYAVRCTCPDVAFAQNITSRFQQNPGDIHRTTVKNILKYLKNTKDMFLTGYVFVSNGGAVDWKSAKQSIFATSSAEAEYIAASKESVRVRKFISGQSVVPTIEEPINQSAGLRMFGSDTIKFDRMDGMKFIRWKEKTKFLLTAFKVYYVLEGPRVGVMTEEEQRKHEQDETLCRGYILSTLTDSLKKLMHTSEDFTLDQIQKYLRIEEETRIREKNLNGASGSKVVCYKCGEKGHIKRYCKNPKKKNQNSNKKDESANAVEQVDTTDVTTMVSELNIGMIQELHMASVTKTDDWWYDSCATTHVCNNRDLFKTYKKIEDGHEVMMGDNHTLKVIGSGNVEIQFTYGKKLTLMNVLHVPNIRKNLVSGNVEIQFTYGKKLTLMNVLHVPNIRKNLVSGFKLCKSKVKAVIESVKVIMSKANVFVGKAYACDGMFKLNINKTISSAYLPDCKFIYSFNIECSTFNLWHNRLRHINYKTMKDMLKQGIISYNGEHKDKCEICVQAKMKRKPFPKVDRQSEMLELVHFDICELNGQLTRGGN